MEHRDFEKISQTTFIVVASLMSADMASRNQKTPMIGIKSITIHKNPIVYFQHPSIGSHSVTDALV